MKLRCHTGFYFFNANALLGCFRLEGESLRRCATLIPKVFLPMRHTNKLHFQPFGKALTVFFSENGREPNELAGLRLANQGEKRLDIHAAGCISKNLHLIGDKTRIAKINGNSATTQEAEVFLVSRNKKASSKGLINLCGIGIDLPIAGSQDHRTPGPGEQRLKEDTLKLFKFLVREAAVCDQIDGPTPSFIDGQPRGQSPDADLGFPRRCRCQSEHAFPTPNSGFQGLPLNVS